MAQPLQISVMSFKTSVKMSKPIIAILRSRYLDRFLVLILLTLMSLMTPTFAFPEFGFNRTVCEDLANKYSKKHNIPDGLVASISRVESGRVDQTGGKKAWPWTLNLAGDSKFFENKAQTLDFLGHALGEGKTNIDIGCMQINYKWHKDEFSGIEQMLDPDQNVKYAIKFLKQLFERHQNWEDAVKHYHSSTESLHTKYYRKVARVFNQIRYQEKEPSISFISALPPLNNVSYGDEERTDFNSNGVLIFASDNLELDDFTLMNEIPEIQTNKKSLGSNNGGSSVFDFIKVSASLNKTVDHPKAHLPDYIKENWKLVLAMRSILGSN